MPSPAMTLDAWLTALLAWFAHAGTVATVGLFLSSTALALRCKGRCCEDEIFRPHVI
ncbi:MAG TPA: hypothetical protein VJ453_04410 [Terriglobales bacterium]|nr:hypothetical protein [Terriglobales bacterium]